MEQIQQHEWVPYKHLQLLGTTYLRCQYCDNAKRVKQGFDATIYVKYGLNEEDLNSWIEPACITRTINAPLRQADK